MIHGVTVQSGRRVILNLMAASHDPDRFYEPDRFRLDRAERFELPFGWGAHHCLGAALARSEMEAALAVLTASFADVALTQQPQLTPPGGMLHGPRDACAELPALMSDSAARPHERKPMTAELEMTHELVTAHDRAAGADRQPSWARSRAGYRRVRDDLRDLQRHDQQVARSHHRMPGPGYVRQRFCDGPTNRTLRLRSAPGGQQRRRQRAQRRWSGA